MKIKRWQFQHKYFNLEKRIPVRQRLTISPVIYGETEACVDFFSFFLRERVGGELGAKGVRQSPADSPLSVEPDKGSVSQP